MSMSELKSSLLSEEIQKPILTSTPNPQKPLSTENVELDITDKDLGGSDKCKNPFMCGGKKEPIEPIIPFWVSNPNIIFNNAGTLAGSNNFIWNGSKVTVTGENHANVHVATNGIVVNSLNVATSYTIAAGYSGTSAGPITVNSGATVTVASGSRWVIV